MSLISKIRDLVAPSAAPSAPKRSSEYMRGNRGVVFNGWRPALREASDEIANAWDSAAARVVDTIHNSGWIAGAIDQAVANTVGTGLRLKVMPENEIFGLDNARASEWAKSVEQRFELFARNPLECDVEGKRTFGQMQAAAFRAWLATGEILAELVWRERSYARYGTKVCLLHPSRLSRKSDPIRNVVTGVRMDGDGLPIAYLAVKKDRFLGQYDVEVPARDALGRPRVVHIFEGIPGTARGISPLVPALYVARQFDQLADATLMASIVQTVFAATITSEEPTEEAMQGLLTPQEQAKMAAAGQSVWDAWFEAQSGWYDSATLDVGINGRIAHLFPGQKMEFLNASSPTTSYRDFSMHLLREMARCLGLTYESATGDYLGATYSSVRMATGEIFAITKARREFIVAPFCQAVYEAWLEEEIEKGGIEFPGGLPAFLENRTAACRALWRGSPKPQADDLKLAKAHEVWARLGVMSDEMIANDLGVDIEDVYAQRAREKELRELYGIEEAMLVGAFGDATPPQDGEEPTDEGKPEEE